LKSVALRLEAFYSELLSSHRKVELEAVRC